MTVTTCPTSDEHNFSMAAVQSRDQAPTTTNSASSTFACHEPTDYDVVLSRSAYIAMVSVCVLTTTISIVILAVLAYRTYSQHRSSQAARSWGRKSIWNQRISVMRKEVDDMYTRQYKGCWQSQVVENPEMRSDSPIELMLPERVWEVPAIPALPSAVAADKHGRKSWKERKERLSLFFDQGVGVWMPKRAGLAARLRAAGSGQIQYLVGPSCSANRCRALGGPVLALHARRRPRICQDTVCAVSWSCSSKATSPRELVRLRITSSSLEKAQCAGTWTRARCMSFQHVLSPRPCGTLALYLLSIDACDHDSQALDHMTACFFFPEEANERTPIFLRNMANPP
nr:hypothetical protein CFP56_09661 [Quercus suber]